MKPFVKVISIGNILDSKYYSLFSFRLLTTILKLFLQNINSIINWTFSGNFLLNKSTVNVPNYVFTNSIKNRGIVSTGLSIDFLICTFIFK